MKKLLLLIIFISPLTLIYAQKQVKSSDEVEKLSKVQFRISTGLNNFSSNFGLGVNVRLEEKILACGGLGIGGWGWKTALGVKYETKPDKSGWALQGGYSLSGGSDNFTYTTTDANGTSINRQMQFKKVHAINLSAAYNFAIRKHHSFFLEFGYSIPLTPNAWVLRSGQELGKADKIAFNLLQPGGLLLAGGFNLGF